jgi:4-hydroxy-tetrahydrodipicolinate synthase
MLELKGVYPAMVTPLTTDEKVDKAGLRNVVQYCLNGGVHGILVLGSTGEFPAMTESMRQDAIETALDEVKGKVPVLIGCGEPGTQRTLEQVKVAGKTTADGVLVAIPYYFPLDQASIIRYYLSIADVSKIPVTMYNFPQMTKTPITPETVEKLAAHPNIIGIKDSCGDFVNLQRYLDVTSGMDFDVMIGNPALGLSGYIHGAKGGIYAGCSLAPKACCAVYDAFMQGRLDEAVILQKRASYIPLVGSFGMAAAVFKFGLHLQGVCGPTVAGPIALAGGQEDKIKSWMRKLGIEV